MKLKENVTRIIPLVYLLVILIPHKSLAHNSLIEYEETRAINITATYGSGKPMKNAQVLIYAPNNPEHIWLKGNTDENGYFIFIPDFNQSGNWNVKILQAGHGGTIRIPIHLNHESQSPNIALESINDNPQIPETSKNVSSSRLTMGQKLIILLALSWGFVGTALFFSKRRVLP